MERKINTRSLTEAALMSGIITIILIVTIYIPLTYMIGIVIVPMPIAVMYYKHDLKYAVCCIVISLFITSMLLNPIIAITSAISYSIVGVTLGYCIKSKKTAYRTVIVVMIACAVAAIVVAWISSIIISDGNLFKFVKEQLVMLSETMNMVMEEAKSLYIGMGISDVQLQLLDEASIIFSVKALAMSLPTVILLYAFLSSYICFGITCGVLKRMRLNNIETLDFAEFYVSNLVGAGLIAMISIGIILSTRGISWSSIAYNATILVMIIVMCINGIAAANYFLKRKMNMTKVPKNLIIIITFMLGSYVIFSIIGFLEMILDFRKLDPHRLRKA